MKKIFYLSIAATIFLSSCKKTENSPAPAGSTKTDLTLSDLYAKEGFIEGTISGKTSSNETINKSFNFELVDESSFEIDPNAGDTIYIITIGRIDASGQIANSYNNYSHLKFTLKKDKSTLISLNNYGLTTEIKKENITSTKFDASFYYYAGGVNATTMILSNVKFNPSKGSISANYTISVGANNNQSGNPATVTGSFSSMNTNVMYRKAN